MDSHLGLDAMSPTPVTEFLMVRHTRDVFYDSNPSQSGAPSTGDFDSGVSHTRLLIKMSRHLLGNISTPRLMLQQCYPQLHNYANGEDESAPKGTIDL